MKLRDKILYMSFGAGLVVLGMVLNSLVSSDADAQVGVKDATFRNVLCERIFTERVLTKDEDKFKTLLGLSDRGVAMIQQVTESKEIRDDMVMTSAIHTNNVTIVNTSS